MVLNLDFVYDSDGLDVGLWMDLDGMMDQL